MFGVTQRACVSFFLGGSNFINDIKAFLSDFETLFPTCNEEQFAAKLLWVWIISPWQRNLMSAFLLNEILTNLLHHCIL